MIERGELRVAYFDAKFEIFIFGFGRYHMVWVLDQRFSRSLITNLLLSFKLEVVSLKNKPFALNVAMKIVFCHLRTICSKVAWIEKF